MLPAKRSGSGMVLTERDRRVIADVASFQVLTRAQLTLLGHFSSKTRGNATLARLVRHGFLSRRHQPSVAGTSRALYFAGPAAQVLLNTSADTHRNSRRRLDVNVDIATLIDQGRDAAGTGGRLLGSDL